MTKNRCWDRGSAPPASPPKNRSLLRAMKAAEAWQLKLENLHSKMLNDCPFTVETVFDFYVEVESWRPACGGCREIQLMVDVVGVCRMDCAGTVRSSSKWWESSPHRTDMDATQGCSSPDSQLSSGSGVLAGPMDCRQGPGLGRESGRGPLSIEASRITHHPHPAGDRTPRVPALSRVRGRSGWVWLVGIQSGEDGWCA